MLKSLVLQTAAKILFSFFCYLMTGLAVKHVALIILTGKVWCLLPFIYVSGVAINIMRLLIDIFDYFFLGWIRLLLLL